MSGTVIRLDLSVEAQQKFEAKIAELGKEEFLRQLSESVGYPVTNIEKVCADNVHWDRSNFITIYKPDNWVATEAALIKRGLIERKAPDEIMGERQQFEKETGYDGDRNLINCCKLTPAGEALVSLFKVVGMFVEHDNALIKKEA